MAPREENLAAKKPAFNGVGCQGKIFQCNLSCTDGQNALYVIIVGYRLQVVTFLLFHSNQGADARVDLEFLQRPVRRRTPLSKFSKIKPVINLIASDNSGFDWQFLRFEFTYFPKTVLCSVEEASR